jgi:hypothetical protein
MQLLDDSLLDLVRKKVVSAEDAFLKATDKQRFETNLKSEGIGVSY